MDVAGLAAYVGPALLFAVLASCSLAALARMAGFGVNPWRIVTLFLALVFLALTQHPFPDPASLDCSQGGAAAIWQPFAILEPLGRVWRRSLQDGFAPGVLLGNKLVQATGMNFGLCAAIGAALAQSLNQSLKRGQRCLGLALGLGVLLSGGAELAQVTGVFGLYPCPYRHFEVDDLILNIGGVLAGFLACRRGPDKTSGPDRAIRP